ncbi:MAG: hypothetical protein IJH09_02805 [Clostridia bacterium]|nr:hypothetical protein [Clostridia bacterium]
MKIKAKLKSQIGETIGETLVALLISALALTMLAGAISTAAKLITKSEAVMETYYAGINALGNPGTDGLSIALSDGAKLVGDKTTIEAQFSKNEAFSSKPIIAYKMK